MDMNIQMPKGYRLLANYKNLIVLAEAENNETPEPFVTWLVVNGSDVQAGKYFVNLEKAQDSFCQRAFGLAPTLYCVAQHIKAYHDQCCDEEVADWGRSCSQCDQFSQCDVNEGVNRISEFCSKQGVDLQFHRKPVCKQVVSRHGVRCTGQWIAPAELLLHHLGESVRVTAHGVYTLAGEKICDCDISNDARKKAFKQQVQERNQQLRQHFNDRP